MRGDVARHRKPGMAARAVMPVLLMQSGRIVAEIDVIDPVLLGRRVEALRASDRGVAAIGELFQRPFTAIRTGDPHRGPQCRLGCAPMPFSSITPPPAK